MPWSPKRARGRARRGSGDGRATPAPSTRRRPAMGEACEHSKSWNRVWNDPSRRQARWCQPILDDGGIDLQTLQVAVAAEDPGAALEAQDQAGVVADRVLGVGVVDQQQRALGFCRAVQEVWQLGIESRRSRARQVDRDEVDAGTRQHPHAGHRFFDGLRSHYQQVVEPRIEAAQKFRIEPAWDVDVGNWSLLAGRGDAALRQRPLARTSRPGQQAQPTHRPPTDPGQRIELRDPSGPRRTGRCRWAWRGAPESGLEHRNGLLQAIWHLSTPPRRDDENAVTSGLPGDVRPDAEADQILSNKCSVVKAASGKKAKVDRRMKEFEPLM